MDALYLCSVEIISPNKKNKMKNSFKMILLMMIIGIVIPFNQGCQKYPDGPVISLKSKTTRISNTWVIDNYKLNGTDYTSLVSGYSETFTKEGGYSYKFGLLEGTGVWAFANNNEIVRITGIDNQSNVDLVIQKLDDSQFWYYYMDGDDKKEFHMVKK
jgi:hypothetical protein